MKHIGHIDGTNAIPSTWKTHTLGMLSPHALFIPNPGERENVSADQWHHVGWVDPNNDGGIVWDTHAQAGDNSRPAYVQREAGEPTPAPTDLPEAPTGFIRVETTIDPMDVRRSEFDQLREAVQTLEVKFQTLARIQQHGPLAPPAPPLDGLTGQEHDDLMRMASPMTFYDHALLMVWSELKNGFPEMQWMDRIASAHKIAGRLTVNRTPKP